MPGRTLAGPTKEGFTSKERDGETGLDYFGARYYMAALGRWTAVDPLTEKHPEWSPYNYVLNDPLVLFDPDGRQEQANRQGPQIPWGPSPGRIRPMMFAGLAARGVFKTETEAGAVAAGFVPAGRVAGGLVSTGSDVATGNFSVGGALLNFLLGGKGRAVNRLGRETVEEGGEIVFKTFTRRNFRENLSRATGDKIAGAHAHHILPHEFADQLASKGINVNDPIFGAWWEAGDHLAKAAEYNAAWRRFLTGDPSREQILDFGRKMAKRYGLEARF